MTFTCTITAIILIHDTAGAVQSTQFTLTPNGGQAAIVASPFNVVLAGQVTTHAIGAQITVTLA